MKQPALGLLLLAALALPLTGCASHEKEGHASDHEELEEAMHELEEIYGKLKAQISDPSKNASSLQLVGDMQEETVEAKQVLPPGVSKLTGQARDEAAARYRGLMIELLTTQIELERALMANDNAKAAQLLEKVHDIEHRGHDAFRSHKH